MRIKLLLFFLLSYSYLYPQRNFIDIRPKALNIGVYDAKKVVRNTDKALYGQEAENAFWKLVEKNDTLKKKWMFEIPDADGNISYSTEYEILTYYPDLGIVIHTGGHGYTGIDDINMEKDICGDPKTYAYSPSGRYRISGLYDDGMRYFLEENIDGNYQCLDLIFYGEFVSGFYWYDDETIHYLKERTRYTKEGEEIKYWVGYSTKFYRKKNDRSD